MRARIRGAPVHLLVIAAAAAASAVSASAAKSSDNVYALCTVRDVTVADEKMKGKVYRSAVFAVPRSYDDEISMAPERGGKVSKEFEAWVWKTYGFRPDRKRLSDGDEHYCIEAPLTLEGKDSLTKLATGWDNRQFPQVELVRTTWARKKSAADERFDAALAEYEASERKRLAAVAKYERDLEAIAAKKAHDQQAAQTAVDKFAAERAAHEAEVARIQADNQRKQQAYREQYKSVTGRYPDE